jgi:hypothetical protein
MLEHTAEILPIEANPGNLDLILDAVKDNKLDYF